MRIVSAAYANKVENAAENVMIVANLYLVPENAYIMMGAYINYHAEQIKSNKVYVRQHH